MECLQASHCYSIQLQAVRMSLSNDVLTTLYKILNIGRVVRPVETRNILLSGKKKCLGWVDMASIYRANDSINK